jgi:hypothetical protein
MLAQECRKRERRVGIQESDSGETAAGIETGIARRTVAYRLRDVRVCDGPAPCLTDAGRR